MLNVFSWFSNVIDLVHCSSFPLPLFPLLLFILLHFFFSFRFFLFIFVFLFLLRLFLLLILALVSSTLICYPCFSCHSLPPTLPRSPPVVSYVRPYELKALEHLSYN